MNIYDHVRLLADVNHFYLDKTSFLMKDLDFFFEEFGILIKKSTKHEINIDTSAIDNSSAIILLYYDSHELVRIDFSTPIDDDDQLMGLAYFIYGICKNFKIDIEKLTFSISNDIRSALGSSFSLDKLLDKVKQIHYA